MIRHSVLDQLASHGVKMGLDRVRSLLSHLGEPHLAYPTVHVAGTNGKGSTCMMITAALVEAGYRVGTNISPHLEQVNERICIDGAPIDDATFSEYVEILDRHRMDWARSISVDSAPLTYFEFVTVMALLVFAARGVHVGVIETGLGGRLDATNVVKPVVTAITTVGLDHQDVLGDTIEQVAYEKAGILHRGAPVILGLLPEAARDVVEQRARRLGCPLWKPGEHLRREHRKGRWSFTTPQGIVRDVDLPLDGEHMGQNALVAVGVLHGLQKLGFHVPDEAIKVGLETVAIGGRLEEIAPGLIVDGAHNLDGTKALAKWLAGRPRPARRILLWGMGRGRDAASIIAPLDAHVDEIVTTRCAHPKARDALDLALELQGKVDSDLSAGEDIDNDLLPIYGEANETIVAGSLYLCGAAKSLVRDGLLRGVEPGSAPPEFDEIDER